MKHNFLRIDLFFILALTIYCSCNKAPVLQLNQAMNAQLDTLVLQQKDSIYIALSKECEENYDQVFEQKVDSILQHYLKEIEALTQ